MEWRLIPSFNNYEVSEFGQVRRCKPGIRGGFVGKVMKPYVREDGYDMYILRKNNMSFHKKAHQLVIEAFVGPKPAEGKWEVRHKDGTRVNNHYSNLEWGTSKDNKADMVRHGTRMAGEKHPMSKLSFEDVEIIREMAKDGVFQCRIAEIFKISQAQVRRIVLRQHWAA